MSETRKVIVIDAGNTSLKIALFEKGEIVEIHRFKSDDFLGVQNLFSTFHQSDCVISSVLNGEKTFELSQIFEKCLIVDQNTALPIEIKYETPDTLGIDRICNAVAMDAINPNKMNVSIDVGTCIKFDLIDDESIYKGGSIAPGIDIRYKSLNDFTANLPLIVSKEKIPLIGRSTKESIQSGVMNGIQSEIIQMMVHYQEEYKDLTFFMTGGDVHYFDIPRKNNIFVDENLTLKGLYQIYLFNAL